MFDKCIIIFLLTFPQMVFGQQESNDIKKGVEILENLGNMFIGEWDGEESGKAGIGKGDRSYQWIFNNKYLFQKNTSVFKPQPQNEGGETHEDWAFFCYDGVRDKIVLRELHIEGFVIQYILDSIPADMKTWVFNSESIENLPPGWKARITYIMEDNNTFDEFFDLAAPDKEYERFLQNHWKMTIPSPSPFP